DLPGDGVRDAAAAGRYEPNDLAVDADGQLREPERKLWDDRDRSGVEYGVDEGAGDVQLQRHPGSAVEPDVVSAIEQCDGLVLCKRRHCCATGAGAAVPGPAGQLRDYQHV